jgi:hypothetical protein
MSPVVQTLEEIFSQLSPDQERALISLPYRVGLYVSFSDTSGGWEAQEAELQSLTGILRQYSEDFCKSEFSQKALLECLQGRGEWPHWAKDVEKVPVDAQNAIALLSPILLEKDISDFKELLVDIALAVAMAFREHAEGPEKAEGSTQSLLARLTGWRKRPAPLDHVNISADEKAALLRLCGALGYDGLGRE